MKNELQCTIMKRLFIGYETKTLNTRLHEIALSNNYNSYPMNSNGHSERINKKEKL